MIRYAVGAVIIQKDLILLVHKVKSGPSSIPGRWDFPRGGIDKGEELESALKRELLEETGSSNYKIIKHFDDILYYEFSPEVQKRSGFIGQENQMFLVEYTGDGHELKPQDDEIDDIKFFKRDDAYNALHITNKEFLDKYKI